MGKHPNERAIPPDVDAVVQQGLLNIVSDGYKIINPDGLDVTEHIIRMSEVVNKTFDEWIARKRKREGAASKA